MKILVTGVNGFIGRHWVVQLHRMGAEVIATGLGNDRMGLGHHGRYIPMDITDPLLVRRVMQEERPDAILHAAAISKPDVCEADPVRADLINVKATVDLLDSAAAIGSYFCFISSDFVFDGERGMYAEDDEPSPINHYGITKLLAEKWVQQYPGSWSIARTVTVYGPAVVGRPNILSTVVDKLERGETYSVFDDQVRTPTYAGDLAWGVARLIHGNHTGIYHVSGEEVMTPYEMAIRVARYKGLDPSQIGRVTAATLDQPARRPLRTGFRIEKIKESIGFRPLGFDEGLRLSFPKN